MLPELADLLDGFDLYAARQGVPPTRSEPAIDAALREAADLARGSERDEPAALFYALARRPRAFGQLHGEMLFLMTVEQAHAVGLDLSFEPVALRSIDSASFVARCPLQSSAIGSRRASGPSSAGRGHRNNQSDQRLRRGEASTLQRDLSAG